jgi:SWI/SNF-related matrix-associated actin-dependent regulator of chromatin subfamily A containing DEAD/H box 1
MESDPISSSPPPFPNQRPAPTYGFDSRVPDNVSSPPPAATYVTQPTQPWHPQNSQVCVLGTSPNRPSPPTTNRLQSVPPAWQRLAPPGTFYNPPRPVVASQPKPYFSSQTQTQLNAPQLESDGEGVIVTDSEDELTRPDPSNIPPAPIVTKQFSRFQYQPQIRKTSENTRSSQPNQPQFSWLAGVTAQRIKEIFPQRSSEEILAKLRDFKWNEADTMAWFAEHGDDANRRPDSADDDELLSPIKPRTKEISRVKPPKLVNKHTIENTKSLAQKYNRTQEKRPLASKALYNIFDGSQEEEVVQPTAIKRRRLIRTGDRPVSRASSPEELVLAPQPKKKIALSRSLPDSDSESVDDSPPASSRYYASSTEATKKGPRTLLQFINVCPIEELMDLANIAEGNARVILSKRPFRSLEQVRRIEDPHFQPAKGKRGGSSKKLGDRIVDASEPMWEGLTAIDELLEKCSEVGETVKTGMRQLNLTTNGMEIESTQFESSRADSGVGSPTSSTEFSTRLRQPEIMAADFKLKDYQVVALNWLNLMYTNSISPILADEMGLGKTACVIAFISHLWELGKKGPHLIVVPGSTLENWIREFKRFSPSIIVYAYHGSQAERREMRGDVLTEPEQVIITTYDMCQNKEDNKFFRAIKPITTVYDEGHMLKNKNSKRYQELMRISTPWRLLLTGTPLQNNLQELVSILGFIMPKFFNEVEEHLNYVFKHRAKTTDKDHKALLSEKRVEKARQMMAPFILRRRKDQILKSIPKKTCRVEYCDMTTRQKEVYDDYTAIHEEALRSREAGERSELRNHLMERRKAAIHPLLFRYHYDNHSIEKIHLKLPAVGRFRGWSKQRMLEEMSWWSDFKIHQVCLEFSELKKWALKDDEWMDSGKVSKLVELVKAYAAEGSRTLVFSQFTQVLDILESVLETEEIKFCRLDGSTNIAQRQEYIDEFHENESLKVFMLSTKSGGTGINLACANKVVIFDSSFNPHDDVQAENRAHRIGQTREVEVVRLVTRDTIEEQIHRLGRSKLALDQKVSGIDEKVADEKGMDYVEKMLLGASTADVSGATSEDDAKTKHNGVKVEVSNHDDAKSDIAAADVKDEFLKSLKAAGVNVKA